MASVRLERVEKAMMQEVGRVLAHDMNDPRVGFTTVTRVAVAPDLKSARVYISVLGNEKARKGTMASLTHAAGYLQREVASRMRMKFTPKLSFFMDDGPEKSIRISNLLDEVITEHENDKTDAG